VNDCVHLWREDVNPTISGNKETAVGSEDRDKVTKTRHGIPGTPAREDRFAGIAPKAVQSVVALGTGNPDDRVLNRRQLSLRSRIRIHRPNRTMPWKSSAIVGLGS